MCLKSPHAMILALSEFVNQLRCLGGAALFAPQGGVQAALAY